MTELFDGMDPEDLADAAPAPTARARQKEESQTVAGPFAEVAVNQPVDQLFTYSVHQMDSIGVGTLVEVPFGRRKIRGCVVRISEESPPGLSDIRVRSVSRVISPGYQLEPELIDLALWIADYYMAPAGDALSCVSFVGFNDVSSQTVRRFEITEAGIDALAGGEKSVHLGAKQRAALLFLAGLEAPATPDEIQQHAAASPSTLKSLTERELVSEIREEVFRGDDYGPLPIADTRLSLTLEQQDANDQILEAMDRREHETFLIHGVTGSGKTEIYLQAISKALAEGGDAIVLVPEISLTPQTVDRFRRRFGEAVGVYHSRLTLGQKFDLWKNIRSGKIRILTGARSAVFAPFRDLRIIVVDEEHETSYKQDSSPRYHARDVAIMRARSCRAVTVLGSATPLVETYFKALNGKFKLLHLSQRVDGRAMPPVEVLDMTKELKEESNPDLFSLRLIRACGNALEAGDQVLLFMNRRGFFNFMVCLNCQQTIKCHHCDSTLTYHKPVNRLLCHLCGREYITPKQCPKCEGTDLTLVGYGTQRVEEYVEKLFPSARVIRMDLDTTRQRNAFLDAWRSIERGEVDIILGTQMIAKGIHLERVTLVGVPLADVSLFQPDFRASERAFSLLTQVSGRAGRGSRSGNVIIQTYVPYHYAIQFAQKHDYIGFYNKEVKVRQVLRFPPHFKLIAVLCIGDEEEATRELMAEFTRILRDTAYRHESEVMILGPAPAPITRINDQYRWRVVIRSKNHNLMKSILKVSFQKFATIPGKSKVTLIPDVDPMDLL